jgi:hypothetical protein
MVDHTSTADPEAGLIPSLSIDRLLAQRGAVIARYASAHTALQEARAIDFDVFGETYGSLTLEDRSTHTRFTDEDSLQVFIKKFDARAWNLLLDKSGLRSFMDAASREKWYKAIADRDIPELTRANVEATFAEMHRNRGDMFEQGVVNVFRKLSWDYKTNKPRLFGKRLVMTRVTYRMGQYFGGIESSSANQLDDLLRVMLVLDGKPEPDHRQGAHFTLTEAQWPNCGDMELHGMVRVRGFKNGNAHLTFLRLDLVEKLNRILARHHPNALPPAEPGAQAA